ncbi:MAG: Sensor protein, partial [Ilumatobacteraceae bacterium]|nr:Sensor protein [Ilumatobacteraceae bacterium]
MTFSLRARLVGSVTAVAFVAVAVAGTTTYELFARTQSNQIDAGLQRAHEPIEELVSTDQTDLERGIEQAAPGTFVALTDPDGTVRFTIPARERGHDPLTTDLEPYATLTWPAGQVIGGPDPAVFRTADAPTGDQRMRLRISRLDNGSILFIGQSLEEFDEARQRLLAIELVVALAALAISAAVGWWLVRVGLRPLHRVEQTALAIADGGDLVQRAPGADSATEVGRVATALNTMLDRIHEAFDQRDTTEAELRASEERMRRFVADVSHELRTPLAAITAYAELFERGARNHPDDLDRALRGISSETHRINEMVEELLLLARLDEGRPLGNATVDLSEVVVSAIGAARAVAPDYPIALKVDDIVSVRGDSARLRQVLDNLIANVRTHTPPGTRTSIQLASQDHDAVITIADDGPGMATDQAARAFERFYRADTSRSRTSGGSGLGLAIVDALVAAHHGTVSLD